jgi:hypothetical protein
MIFPVWNNWIKPGYAMIAFTNAITQTCVNIGYHDEKPVMVPFHTGIIYVPLKYKHISINSIYSTQQYYHGMDIKESYERVPAMIYVGYHRILIGQAIDWPSATHFYPPNEDPQLTWIEGKTWDTGTPIVYVPTSPYETFILEDYEDYKDSPYSKPLFKTVKDVREEVLKARIESNNSLQNNVPRGFSN